MKGAGGRGAVDRTARRRHRARAERELEALVAISTPSGDVHGAEEAVALVAALAPDEATIERIPCSSPDHAADLLVRLAGIGRRRMLLAGPPGHGRGPRRASLAVAPGRAAAGLGTIDMKGGDVLALGVLRALGHPRARLRRGRAAARVRRGVARRALRPRPALRGLRRLPVLRGRPAGRRRSRGVVVRRKAAGTLSVTAHGRSAHSGSAPERGSTPCWPWPRRRRRSRQPGPARPAAADRGPDRAACRRRLQRRARHGRAGVRPARRQARGLRAECCGRCRPSWAARAWRPSSCASGPGWTLARPPRPFLAAAAAALGRPVIGAGRGGASDARPLRGHHPVHRGRPRPARGRRARAARIPAGPVAEAPCGGRAGRRPRCAERRESRKVGRDCGEAHSRQATRSAELSARLLRSS